MVGLVSDLSTEGLPRTFSILVLVHVVQVVHLDESLLRQFFLAFLALLDPLDSVVSIFIGISKRSPDELTIQLTPILAPEVPVSTPLPRKRTLLTSLYAPRLHCSRTIYQLCHEICCQGFD